MSSNAIVNKNSDFLFIYEAIMCNPNGDPDNENKPRMDYETKTNLVLIVLDQKVHKRLFKNAKPSKGRRN